MLTFNSVQQSDEAVYTVTVTDVFGTIESTPGYLFVYTTASLSVVQSPGNMSVVSGGEMVLSTVIAGTPPPFTYEWRRLSPAPPATYTNFSINRSDFLRLTAPVIANGISVTQSWRLVVKGLANANPGVSPGHDMIGTSFWPALVRELRRLPITSRRALERCWDSMRCSRRCRRPARCDGIGARRFGSARA